jgi:hypothetical protein
MPTSAHLRSPLQNLDLFHPQTIRALLPGPLSIPCLILPGQNSIQVSTKPLPTTTSLLRHSQATRSESHSSAHPSPRRLPRAAAFRLDFPRSYVMTPVQLPHTAKLASVVHMFRNRALYTGTGYHWRNYFFFMHLFSVLVSRLNAHG